MPMGILSYRVMMADTPISDSSELNPAQPKEEIENDPGIIILLNDDDAIHACLQLLAAGPPLQIGYPVVQLAPGR